MAALKRKICEDVVEKKRTRMEEDRLSKLPDDLKLHILSLLDTKDALKTSMLSKTWFSLWSWIPVMEFNSFHIYKLRVFDKFVNTALRLRDRSGSAKLDGLGSAKLDRLTFIRSGKCSTKLLKKVFEYAFSHGVKKFEAYVDLSRNDAWPVCLQNTYSFECLTSLTLKTGGDISINCPFLGPRSGSFKNLSVLHLRRAFITDLDPFSGFPVLERLTLDGCVISTEGRALNVHAINLLELTIRSYQKFYYCKLTTPRLRFLEYEGYCQLLHNNKDLHDFDTMVIDCVSCSSRPDQKRMFDNLLSLFYNLNNVKSLTLFWSSVEFLSSFQEELVKGTSPFRNLKCLKLDFSHRFDGPSSESDKIASDVKAYLLQKSPDAKVHPIIYRNYSTT